MSVLPIVARELSVQARRKSTYWIRVLASAIASFLMLWLAVVAAAPISSISQGRTLFTVLSVLAFVYCLVVGAVVTADCLSGEKRDGTIGLLFLTHLRGYDVVFGKLVSSSIHAVFGLLAVVPMMSLALLFGGLTAWEIARTAVVLANTLFLSLAAGIFVSTVSRNERKAVFAAILLVMIVAVGPYQLAFYVANISFSRGAVFRLDEAVLAISPVYAFNLCRPSAIARFQTFEFYGSLAQTHAIAWVLLTMASGIIPGVCKDRPKGKKTERWSAQWRRLTSGDHAQRSSFRTRLLNRNPCLWLSFRHRYKAMLPWILILPLAVIGFWIYRKYSIAFYESSLVLVFTLHLLLKIWLTGEACNRWIEDRRNNALELLLCAPLRTRKIIRGQGLALLRQFGWPVTGVLGLSVLALFGIESTAGMGTLAKGGRTWILISIPVLIADLVALRWVGMWSGLTARGFNRAIIATLARVLFLRWPVYLGISGFASVWVWIGLGPLPLMSHPFAWLFLALAFDLIFGWQARHNVHRYLRAIAADPSNYRAVLGDARVVSSTDSAVAELAGAELKYRTESHSPKRAGQRDSGSTGPSRSTESWSRKRKWMVAIASCLLVLFGIIGLYRRSLEKQVEHRLEMLRAAGLPTTIGELERLRTPLPDEENAALVLERAYPKLVRPETLPQSVQKNLPGQWARFPSRSGSLPIETRESIGSVLSSNKTALAILQSTPDLRKARYAVHWSAAGSTQYKSLLTMSKLLLWETYYHVEGNRSDAAVQSIRSLIHLGISLESEPFWTFQMMRNQCFDYALIGLERLLNRHRLEGSALESLQEEFARVEERDDGLPRSLIGLRCYAIEAYRATPAAGTFFRPGTSVLLEQLRVQLRFQLSRMAGMHSRSLIASLDRLDDFDEIVGSPYPERFELAKNLLKRTERTLVNRSQNGPWGSRYLFEQLVKPNAEHVARCRVAATALAIERIRFRENGQVPDRLADLVPEFLSEIPDDPFDGKPIRFMPLQKGYRVYSIGADEADNEGAEVTNRRLTRMPKANYDITFTVER